MTRMPHDPEGGLVIPPTPATNSMSESSEFFLVSPDTVHFRAWRIKGGPWSGIPMTEGWRPAKLHGFGRGYTNPDKGISVKAYGWEHDPSGTVVHSGPGEGPTVCIMANLPRLLHGDNIRLLGSMSEWRAALARLVDLVEAAFGPLAPMNCWLVRRVDICTYMPIDVLDLQRWLDGGAVKGKRWWRVTMEGARSLSGCPGCKDVRFIAYDKATESYGAAFVSSWSRVEWQLTKREPKRRGLDTVAQWTMQRFAEVFRDYLNMFGPSCPIPTLNSAADCKWTLPRRFAAAEVATGIPMAPFATAGLTRPRALAVTGEIRGHVLAMGPAVQVDWNGLLSGAVLDLPDRPPGAKRRGGVSEEMDAGDDPQGPPPADLLPDLLKDRNEELEDAFDGMPDSPDGPQT